MKSLLAGKETKKAYSVRKDLLRDFPDLHDHQRLMTLIRQASDIQHTFVKPSTKLPTVLTDQRPSESLSTIVLTTLVGKKAIDLRGETLYLEPAARSWRSTANRDSSAGGKGFLSVMPRIYHRYGSQAMKVLLSDSSTLEVIRCGSRDGDVQWRVLIEESFSLPVAVDDDVYVATDSGRLMLLDAVSGEVKWATQFPQALETGPGVDGRANRVTFRATTAICIWSIRPMVRVRTAFISAMSRARLLSHRYPCWAICL